MDYTSYVNQVEPPSVINFIYSTSQFTTDGNRKFNIYIILQPRSARLITPESRLTPLCLLCSRILLQHTVVFPLTFCSVYSSLHSSV